MERHSEKLEDLRESRSMIEGEISKLSALLNLSGEPERYEEKLALMREGKGALDRKIVELEGKETS